MKKNNKIIIGIISFIIIIAIILITIFINKSEKENYTENEIFRQQKYNVNAVEPDISTEIETERKK